MIVYQMSVLEAGMLTPKTFYSKFFFINSSLHENELLYFVIYETFKIIKKKKTENSLTNKYALFV